MGEQAHADRPDNVDRPDYGAHPEARSGPGHRRQVRPDDRQTTILPAVVDPRTANLSNPIDEVKAALDSSSSTSPPRDAIEEVRAALDGRSSASRSDDP
ncbi:MAG TPA: hypothetical protein VGC05_00170, partial [Mycobacterium sp.]